MKPHNFAILLPWSIVFLSGCGAKSVATQSVAVQPTRVQTVQAVQSQVIRKSRQPANVIPFYETQIRSKVGGYISELRADIGDIVQAGQLLAKIDIPEMRQQRSTILARIQLLQSEVEAANANCKLADAGISVAQAKVVEAKSLGGQASAALASAKAEFQRTSELVERRTLAAKILDEIREKVDSQTSAQAAVAAAVESADAGVLEAEARRAEAESKLKVASAQLDVARSQLAELDVSMSYADVQATLSGVLTKRTVEVGDLIDSMGTKSLFTISQIDKVRIHIPIPETDAPFVQAGDQVVLSFPSFRAEPAIQATVTRVASSLEPSTRTMLAEVELPNPDKKLLPGMFGEAEIELETKVASKLPARAIRFDESGKSYVYRIDAAHQVEIVEVTTGMDSGQEIEILNGIEAGQIVIDAHLKRFAKGQVVQPL